MLGARDSTEACARDSMHHPATIAAGATFQGRYEVHAEIGSGGFARVYRATQLATGQSVAIKVLRWQDRQESSFDRILGRFLREMRLCARLHHPNIVRLIDSGESEGGALYTVFEFVPGQNLADVLAQEGALDPLEARHLMLQVLDALACAHAKGIVHRDLKPNNIMVTTGARRNALVLDFGISGIIGTTDCDRENLTVTGEMLGSPRYAAPEQFLREPPTPRSDLFSWALVFLESLTGSGASVRGMHGLVMRRLDPEPVSLPRPISEHPLGDILRRALVKDVAARVVTADALLRDLEARDMRDLPRATKAPHAAAVSHCSSRSSSGGWRTATGWPKRTDDSTPPRPRAWAFPRRCATPLLRD
jgi:serine/threonine protein kinase